MLKILGSVPAVLLAFGLVLGSHLAAAQEPGDPARLIAEIRNDVNRYAALTKTRTLELGRKLEVLGELTDAADAVSPIAMGQSLSRARQKVEEARRSAGKEPPLEEPVPMVVDIVSQFVTTPPFGMPADQLRAKLFVEISKLEEDILRQSESFQREAYTAEMLAQSLDQIQRNLHSAAVAGGAASLDTRKRALKGGS